MNILLVYMFKSHLQTLNYLNPCLITPIIRSYTTKSIIINSPDFKISFLKDKCGLSGKTLIHAGKYVNFDSSDQRPNSVIDLFRTFGFTQPNITRIISSCPSILQSYHPQKVIKPKLDFLLSISQSQQDVVDVVTKTPRILTTSLTNHLIPSINLLNSVTGSFPNTLSLLKHNPYILTKNLPQSFLLNTQFLLALGVPHSQILKLLRNSGPVLAEPHDKLRNAAVKVKDMGFNLESSYFLNAIHTLCFVSDSTWESRRVLLRSFGFSDHEILSMFKKLPLLMCYTEKNIKEKMDIFMNKLQWTPFRLSSYPVVLAYSLEKRIVPRCSVLQVLVLKNITSQSYMLSTILAMTQRKFVKDFVTVHKVDFPEVMEAYQGKLRFDEYTFKQN